MHLGICASLTETKFYVPGHDDRRQRHGSSSVMTIKCVTDIESQAGLSHIFSENVPVWTCLLQARPNRTLAEISSTVRLGVGFR